VSGFEPVVRDAGTRDEPAVELRGIVAGYYADQPVLQGLDVTCMPGRVTVLLGPNGAGKSTALRVMAGLLRPSSGRVLLFGQDVAGQSAHDLVRAGVAYLPQGRSTFPELTVEENLELGGWLLRRHKPVLRQALERVYERYPSLSDRRKSRADRLSGGQQRLLEISRALICDPRIVLVDEPSVGLSPILADQSYEELKRLKDEGRTVVMVDQNVRPAVALADHVYSLRHGRTDRQGAKRDMGEDLSALVREWLGVATADPAGARPFEDPVPPGAAR